MALRARLESSSAISQAAKTIPAAATIAGEFKRLDGFVKLLKGALVLSQGSVIGETFVPSLSEIKKSLEKVLAYSGDPAMAQSSVRNVYQLATEKLVPHMTKIKTSKAEMGGHLLDILCYALALDSSGELVAMFPVTFASSLLYLPCAEWSAACDEIMSRLSYYVLPKCLASSPRDSLSSVSMSATSVLMMVLDGCPATKHHLLVADTLLQLKRGVCTDMLSVIAYGTSSVRQRALNLILYYWPLPNPEFTHHPSTMFVDWSTPNCENSQCRRNAARATMLCLDHACVAQHQDKGKSDATSFYLLLCPDCDATIHGSPPDGDHLRLPVPRPLRDVKPNCEFQKICSGKEWQVNKAEVTCYDISCTAIQNGQPIRMCRDCHNKQHRDCSDPRHIFQIGPPDPWSSDDLASCSAMLEAVAKLLEATPTLSSQPIPVQRGGGARTSVPHSTMSSQIELGVGKEGLWLLSHYCTLNTKVRPRQREWLVRLVALVLEWLRCYHVLLHSRAPPPSFAPSAPSADEGEFGADLLAPDSAHIDYAGLFTNYVDVANLVRTLVIPWLRSVLGCNVECVVEALQPELKPCAQVGRLWNRSHEPVERYRTTLSVLHRLYLLFKDRTIPERGFLKVFNTVMPQWLETLIALRSEPGRMDALQKQFRELFTSYESHDDGLKTFDFIWEKFRGRDMTTLQRALFWLQDLTRLKVKIPYLPHMFEDALKGKKGGGGGGGGGKGLPHQKSAPLESGSSFDEEMEGGRGLWKRANVTHKDSTGSISGYESESPLISQASIEQGDAQEVVSLNSSIARFILMLDVWYSQLNLKDASATLCYTALQKTLVKMLSRVWGTNHTFADHVDPLNSCLLCRAMALWFSLATRLITSYAKREKENSPDDGTEDPTSPLHFRQRVSLKISKVPLPHPRRNKAVSTADAPPPNSDPLSRRAKKMSHDSLLDSDVYKSRNDPPDRGGTEMDSFRPRDHERLKLPVYRSPRLRKLAKVQSYSEFTVVSRPDPVPGGSGAGPLHIPPAYEEDGGEEGGGCGESSSTLYRIFKLCAQKLSSSKMHPDAMHQIVQCLTALVRSGHVLSGPIGATQIEDVEKLLETLWKCLETDISYVARSCVALLLDCLQFLASCPTLLPELRRLSEEPPVRSKLQQGGAGVRGGAEEEEEGEGEVTEEASAFWKMVRDDLTSNHWLTKFRTVEKLVLVLQFMVGQEGVVSPLELHPSFQSSLSRCFCLATLLLNDKHSSVTMRARYCLNSLKESSLEVLRQLLPRFFADYPGHRHLILQSLSLVDSVLPSLNFLNITLFKNLLKFQSFSSQADDQIIPPSSWHGKKYSDASILSGIGGGGGGGGVQFKGATPKVSTASSVGPAGMAAAAMMEDDPESVAIVQTVISLLLRHLGNPRADLKETMKKSQSDRSQQKRGGTFKGRKSAVSMETSEVYILDLLQLHVCRYFHYSPSALRQSRTFEIFLTNIFPVLDRNVEFGHTPGLLLFILKLLGYSAAPTGHDFPHLSVDDRARDNWRSCPYSLSTLPPKLQAPWLRVFFVFLYKYIHKFSDSDSADSDVLVLFRWCMEVTLNSLEVKGHTCSLLSTAPRGKPLLRRQDTVESYLTASLPDTPDPVPAVNIIEGSPLSTRFPLTTTAGSKDVATLATLPEERGSVRDSLSPPPLSPPPLPPSSPHPFPGHDAAASEESLNIMSSTAGLCVICGKPTNEYTEEVVALCVVVMGTCCHRMPHDVSSYLVYRIIPAISKVVVPGSYSWQTTSDPPPGSAMSVATHFLASILTQFADRRLFLYLFAHDLGSEAETLFQAVAACLTSLVEGEGEGGGEKEEKELYQSSPIKYFFEDAVSSSRFTNDVRHFSLINLATYVGHLPASNTTLFRNLPLWEAFCKKLKGHSELLRDTQAMQAFFRVVVTLLEATVDSTGQISLSNYHAHTVQLFMQSLAAILEAALRHVYVPFAGLVTLAGLWYKVFQQHSSRESEKFVKLYISELRKALKSRCSGDSIRPDNLLGLIQVLLLEEDGHLGYVDGLTRRRHYAPDLKHRYETHCLSVIDSLQWDFVDALQFLSTHNHRWTPEFTQMISQVKLSLAQLVALRVQHGRAPASKLHRLLAGDVRPIATNNPGGGVGGGNFTPRWEHNLSAVHIFSWLLLGAMCHNAIDAATVAEDGLGGQCRLLSSVNVKMEQNTEGMIRLTREVLQRITVINEVDLGYLYATFNFAAIWTVYMELYVRDPVQMIVKYWENIITFLVNQFLGNPDMDEISRKDVVLTLKDMVVYKIKKIGLSCFSLLIPVWQRLLTILPEDSVPFPDLPHSLPAVTPDVWFKEAVKELVLIEVESQPREL